MGNKIISKNQSVRLLGFRRLDLVISNTAQSHNTNTREKTATIKKVYMMLIK